MSVEREIAIHQPVCFNETGGRSNNEDSIYPALKSATVSDKLFLVCDGVGGEHKGEVASSLACRCLSYYFSKFPQPDITSEYIQKALDYTRIAFENIENEDSETHGMATTMTLLCLLNSKVAVSHLGDSRVYHIRNGKILYKTKDHKWVNELVESGLITEEQAREHPKRNVISKVISAKRSDQADFHIIRDVKPGDYFFMCTDGVLERVYDELLEYHLRDNPDNQSSPQEIMAVIKEECEGKTNDNFSAYLIKVKNLDHSGVAPIIPGEQEKPATQNGILYTISLLVLFTIFAGTAFFFMQKRPDEKIESITVSDTIAAGKKTDFTVAKVKPDQKKSKIIRTFPTRNDSKKSDSQANKEKLHEKRVDSPKKIITDEKITGAGKKSESKKDTVSVRDTTNAIHAPVLIKEPQVEKPFKDTNTEIKKTPKPILPKKDKTAVPDTEDQKIM